MEGSEMSEHLETKLKDKSKESDHFRLLCGTWRHKTEELDKDNANKDLLLKQKTERINELEKENDKLKELVVLMGERE